MKKLTPFLMLAGLVLLAGCSSPWKVVRKAQTNPFTKQERYVVSETKTNNLQVGQLAESVYTSQIGSAEKRRWRIGKTVFGKAFAGALKLNAKGLNVAIHKKVKPRDFQVYSNLYFVSPYNAGKNTMVKVRVRLMQRNKTFDVLLLQISVPTSKGQIGNRLKYAGATLGKHVAKYLLGRVR